MRTLCWLANRISRAVLSLVVRNPRLGDRLDVRDCIQLRTVFAVTHQLGRLHQGRCSGNHNRLGRHTTIGAAYQSIRWLAILVPRGQRLQRWASTF